MKFTTIKTNSGSAAAAILNDGAVLNLQLAASIPDLVPEEGRRTHYLSNMSEVFKADRFDQVRQLVEAIEADRVRYQERLEQVRAIANPENVQFCAPLPAPSLLLSQGLAYKGHLAEMNTPIPSEPTAFVKVVSSITGTGSPIFLPRTNPDMVDFEGEFSLVIGRDCHAVSAADAMSYVAGYTLINDVSARDWVAPVFASGLSNIGAAMAWAVNIQGKQFPTFTPMGPVMVTADEIPDPHDVKLMTHLNGEVMQDAHSGDLIFPIPDLIAHFSQWYAFRAGDVITTGTPAGVGFGRNPKVFLKDGDLIEISVARIGTLSNRIVATS
jgi:2-keto-4-pentenoate hydratase/2-oxohepta-3-ene-1,7-dioic acid hydratase in catechol pathway